MTRRLNGNSHIWLFADKSARSNSKIIIVEVKPPDDENSFRLFFAIPEIRLSFSLIYAAQYVEYLQAKQSPGR